jgi:hypothetical protein
VAVHEERHTMSMAQVSTSRQRRLTYSQDSGSAGPGDHLAHLLLERGRQLIGALVLIDAVLHRAGLSSSPRLRASSTCRLWRCAAPSRLPDRIASGLHKLV